MKKYLKHTPLLIAVLLFSGCFRNDIRTVTYSIEQLRNQQSTKHLAQSLRNLNGIKEFHPDLDKKTVTIVFNGKELYLKNIEHAIVKGGFDLPNWPAVSADKAKLPKELQ